MFKLLKAGSKYRFSRCWYEVVGSKQNDVIGKVEMIDASDCTNRHANRHANGHAMVRPIRMMKRKVRKIK